MVDMLGMKTVDLSRMEFLYRKKLYGILTSDPALWTLIHYESFLGDGEIIR